MEVVLHPLAHGDDFGLNDEGLGVEHVVTAFAVVFIVPSHDESVSV